LIYCTLLNPAVDAVYEIDEIQTGATATNVKSRVFPAGKGINVATTLKILGEEVCVVGIIHENNRRQFTEYLERLGIQSHFLAAPGTSRINVTLIETKAGQSTHINSAQAPVPSGLQEELLELLRSKLAPGDLCACCGSVPPGMGNDSYQKLIKLCKEKGAIVLLDSGGKPLKMGVRAKPHMVKPNLEELEGFFDENIQGVHHIALKGKRLFDMGVGFVFISLGSDGMIAIHENDCLLCLAPTIRAVNTVGCGDALVGGLLAGYGRKFSFTEMSRMAVACGASNALHYGAGDITRDEIWRLMEEVTIKAV
jgi:1-phosphofructokinase family hexose kinase